MDMIGRIRRLHSRDKLSDREIARRTGLSRNTVAKWLRAEVKAPPKYQRASTTTEVDLRALFLAEIPAPRGVPARCAAGAGLP